MSKQSAERLIYENEGGKKKMKKGKIGPMKVQDQWYNNAALNDEGIKADSALDKFRSVVEKTNNHPINVLSNVKVGVIRWKKYATCRRKNDTPGFGKLTRRPTGGIGLDKDVVDDFKKSGPTQHQMAVVWNRNLIQYFAKLGQSETDGDSINLELVDSLLSSGANINCTDKYGQTLLHEVARAWHVDVARYLLENKADINQPDNYGRTPLHVAAAVDYPEMVNFLIENGANKEACTKGELQTPVHFAARNDACLSLKALIKNGCLYKDVRDHKLRTPLHVAAELDRSETARMLLELDDPAPAGVVDHSGQSAIVWMITKMAPVAKVALDQLHTTDRANRKQYYHLHHLEPKKPNEKKSSPAPTALQMIVSYKQYDLITHPAISELIVIKWAKFGKLGAWLSLMINILFILAWTTIGIVNAILGTSGNKYTLPDSWWRIFLYVLAFLLTAYQIKEELSEYYYSRKAHELREQWREEEINLDLQYAHPRWPEEKEFLMQEKKELNKLKPQYFNDFWNIFDWICYVLLLVCLGLHIADIFTDNQDITRVQIRLMAITVIFIWLRLMKYARAFSSLGPFIVMLGHMVGDVLRFGFLYMEFYIPFACAFWMIYGGSKVEEQYLNAPDALNHTMTVSGYETVDALLFSMFRLTLVDEYDYEGMRKVDSLMAYILVTLWLMLSAILCLNLFIALMSDTFQRVYDNAKANAVMQKAVTILSIEEGMGMKRRNKFRSYIHSECSPKEKYYDDDATESSEDDLKKVTIQIKEDLDDLRETLEQNMRSGNHRSTDEHQDQTTDTVKPVSAELLEKEVDTLREEIADLRDYQEDVLEEMSRNMETVLHLLQTFAQQQQPLHTPGGARIVDPNTALVSRRSVDPLVRTLPSLAASREFPSSRLSRSRTVEEDYGAVDSNIDPLSRGAVIPPHIEISSGFSAASVQPPDNSAISAEGATVHVRHSVQPAQDQRPPTSDC